MGRSPIKYPYWEENKRPFTNDVRIEGVNKKADGVKEVAWIRLCKSAPNVDMGGLTKSQN